MSTDYIIEIRKKAADKQKIASFFANHLKTIIEQTYARKILKMDGYNANGLVFTPDKLEEIVVAMDKLEHSLRNQITIKQLLQPQCKSTDIYDRYEDDIRALEEQIREECRSVRGNALRLHGAIEVLVEDQLSNEDGRPTYEKNGWLDEVECVVTAC